MAGLIQLEKIMDLDSASKYLAGAAPSTVLVCFSYMSDKSGRRRRFRRTVPLSTLCRERHGPEDRKAHCPPDDTTVFFVKLRVSQSWKPEDERDGKRTDIDTGADGILFGHLMDRLEAAWGLCGSNKKN